MICSCNCLAEDFALTRTGVRVIAISIACTNNRHNSAREFNLNVLRSTLNLALAMFRLQNDPHLVACLLL